MLIEPLTGDFQYHLHVISHQEYYPEKVPRMTFHDQKHHLERIPATPAIGLECRKSTKRLDSHFCTVLFISSLQ